MYKEIDSEQVLRELIEENTDLDIVLYGAGNYGITFKRYLEKIHNVKIKNFVVTDTCAELRSVDDVAVNAIDTQDRECKLVICVSEQKQSDLIEKAMNLGFNKIYVMLNEYVRYMKSELNEKHLNCLETLKFEVHITDHCNLNCKGCYHFSPISEPVFLSTEEFEKDMRRMHQVCEDKVSSITLLGGEPLLHPQITDFFRIVRLYFQKCRVNLLTNGTLLKDMKDSFWRSLVENRITLCCTKYPVYVDYNVIEEKAAQYGIKVIYHNDVGAGQKTLIKYPFDISGSQDVEWNYKHCTRSNKCITLKHGRIFTCPMAAHAHIAKDFFGLNLELSADDSISIYQVKTMREISEFLVKPIPFCRYCDLKKKPKQMEWKVSKKEVGEWF